VVGVNLWAGAFKIMILTVGLTVYYCCRSMSTQTFVREYDLGENGLEDRASTVFIWFFSGAICIRLRTQSAEMEC
jgi:hypothetical protein